MANRYNVWILLGIVLAALFLFESQAAVQTQAISLPVGETPSFSNAASLWFNQRSDLEQNTLIYAGIGVAVTLLLFILTGRK